MAKKQLEIVDDINSRINAKAFLEFINYYPDKIQEIQSNIKCFCPLHKETKFRSLMIDTKKNTYKCSINNCEGSDGGTLVDLYAKLNQTQHISSALTLAKAQNIEIPDEIYNSIIETFIAAAQKDISKKNFESALKNINEALNISPDNIENRSLLAEVFVKLGNQEEAVSQYTEIAKLCKENNDTKNAIETLKKILGIYPDNIPTLESLADLYIDSGNNKEAINSLSKVADYLRKTDNYERQINNYQKILNLDKNKFDVREELAKAYEKSGDKEKAVSEYKTLALNFEEKGDLAKTAIYYEQIDSLHPEDLENKEFLANLYLKSNNIKKSVEFFNILGNLALETDKNSAEKFFTKINEIDPENIGNIEKLAGIYKSKNDNPKATELLRKAVDLLIEKEDLPKAIEILNLLKKINPHTDKYPAQLAEIYTKQKKVDNAVEEYFIVCKINLENNEADLTKTYIDKIVEIIPENIESRLNLCAMLDQYKQDKLAIPQYIDLAKVALKNDAFDELLRICDQGLNIYPESTDLKEFYATALSNLEEIDKAIEVYHQLVEWNRTQEEFDKALTFLKNIIDLDPNNIDALNKLVEIYTEQGENEKAKLILIKLDEIYEDLDEPELLIQIKKKIIGFNPEETETIDRLAKLLCENGDTDEGIKYYNQLADIYLKNNDKEKALLALDQIIAFEDDNIETLKKILNIHLKNNDKEKALEYAGKIITIAKRSKDLDKIIDAFDTAFAIDKENTQILGQLIEYQKESNKIDQACENLVKIADIYDRNFSDIPAAINSLLDYLSLKEDDLEVHRKIADYYEKLGDVEKSIEHLKICAGKFEAQYEYDKSVEIFLKVIHLNPDDEDALYKLSDIYVKLNQNEKAVSYLLKVANINKQDNDKLIDIYRKILTVDADRIDIRVKLAQIYEFLEQIEEAELKYIEISNYYQKKNDKEQTLLFKRKVSKINPTNFENKNELIQLLMDYNREDEAVVELDELTKDYLSAGDIDNAEGVLQRLKKIKPNDPSILERLADIEIIRANVPGAVQYYYTLSDFYLQNHDIVKSIGSLNKIKDLETNSPTPYEKIIEIYKKAGDLDKSNNETIGLIKLMFSSNSLNKALAHIQALSKENITNIELRLSLIKLLNEYSLDTYAIKEYDHLIDDLVDNKKFDDALKVIVEGTKQDENHIYFYETKIKILKILNKTDEIIEEYQRLANKYLIADNKEKFEDAIKHILEIDKNNIEAHKQLSNFYINEDLSDKAIEELKLIGDLYIKQNQLSQAGKIYEQILSIDNIDINAKIKLADIYKDLSEPEDAIKMYFEIAEFFKEEEDYPSAINYYENILAVDNTNISANEHIIDIAKTTNNSLLQIKYSLNLAKLYEANESYFESISLYNDLLDMDKENLEYLNHLSVLYEKTHDITNSIKTLNRVVSVYIEYRDHKSALDLLKHIHSLRPTDISTIDRLIETCKVLNKREEIIDWTSKKANRLIEENLFDKAVEPLNELIYLDSKNIDFKLQLADSYKNVGENDKAADQYELIISLLPKKDKLADVISYQEQILKLSAERVAVKESYCDNLTTLGRKDEAVENLLGLSQQFQKLKDIKKAIKCCEKAIVLNDKSTEGYKIILSYLESSDNRDAIINYTKKLVDLLLEELNYPEASTYLENCIDLAPENLELRQRLAHIYLDQGNLEKAKEILLSIAESAISKNNLDMAIETLEMILSKDPINISVIKQMIGLYHEKKDIDKVIQYSLTIFELYLDQGDIIQADILYKKIIELRPKDNDIKHDIADIFSKYNVNDNAALIYLDIAKEEFKKDKFKNAIRILEETISNNAELVDAYELMANAYLKMDQLEKSYDLFFITAKKYLTQGNIKKSIALFEKTCQLKPDDIMPHKHLVSLYSNENADKSELMHLNALLSIYLSKDKFDEALITCHSILSLDPDNIETREKYIEIYQQIGSEMEIIEDYCLLAKAYAKKNLILEATQTYEKVIKIEPDNLSVHNKFIHYLIENGQITRACDELHDLIKIAHSQHNYRIIIDSMRKLITVKSDDVKTYFELCDIYAQHQMKNNAITILMDAANKFNDNNNKDVMIKIYKKIISVYPNHIDTINKLINILIEDDKKDKAIQYLLELCNFYNKEGFLDNAAETYRRIIELAPEDISMHQLLIDTYVHIGFEEECLPEYWKLAQLYANQNMVKSAVQVYKKIIELEPLSIEARVKYIDLYLQYGLEQDLLEDYMKLAEIYENLKNWNESLKYYEKVTLLDKQNTRAKQSIEKLSDEHGTATLTGIVDNTATIQETKDIETTIKNYIRILEINPNNAATRLQLADIYLDKDQQDKAIFELELAARTFLDRGELEKGIEVCEKILEINPNHQNIRNTLSKSILRRDSMKAIESAIDAYRTPAPDTYK